MEDPVLAEAGLRLAGPCPDGRAAHPAASGGQTSNAGARDARRPHHHRPVPHDRRATSELRQQMTRSPFAGRQCIMARIGRFGGTLSPGGAILGKWLPKTESARGPLRKAPRPQERIIRCAGQSASSAPLLFPGALRGVPARRGRRRRCAGSGAGEGLPLNEAWDPETLSHRNKYLDVSACSRKHSHMANLDSIFHGLADPTRRAVIARLANGPAPVSELARPHDMALASFLKHLKVLERGGWIQSDKHGRVRTCRLRPEAAAAAEGWLGQQRAMWEARLDRLDTFLASLPKEGKSDET